MSGSGSRKRTYRQIVICSICSKECHSDNFARHKSSKHVEKDTCSFLPELIKVFKIFATLPVSICEAERSFSTMKRLKTYLRSTMLEERLNSLAVLNIHRDVCNKVVEEDMDKLINKFAEGSGRKLYFF